MFKSGPFLVLLGLVVFQVFGAPMPDASTSTTTSSTVTIVSTRSSDATTMITSTASPSTIDPDVASSTFVEKQEVTRNQEATAKEEVTTQEPSSSIHPRFKFMEAQMEHKHKDLEEDFKDFSDTPSSTVPPTTTTQAIPTSCPGCPFEAEVKKDIVDFAVQELVGGEAGLCKKSLVRVENFISQVVAGMLYKFDLVLEHHPENPASCQVPLSNPETCRMVVYDIPWQEKMTVQWDQVDCSGNPSMLTKSTTSTSPIVSSSPSPSTTREPPVESSSGGAVTSTPDIVTSTSAFSIHPRFKYMEAEMKELEQENTVENDVQSTATRAVTTTIPVNVKNIDDTLVPINFPTLYAGGLLPGGPGTVRKIKKVSREEKKRMLEEINLKFSPVVEDIKEEFGILLKSERDKSTEEIKGLKQTIDDLEEKLEKAKEKYRPSWLPGWGWF